MKSAGRREGAKLPIIPHFSLITFVLNGQSKLQIKAPQSAPDNDWRICARQLIRKTQPAPKVFLRLCAPLGRHFPYLMDKHSHIFVQLLLKICLHYVFDMYVLQCTLQLSRANASIYTKYDAQKSSAATDFLAAACENRLSATRAFAWNLHGTAWNSAR